MAIQHNLTQALALLNDAGGYLDKVRQEAEDIADRAGKLDAKAVEFDALCQAVSDKKAELVGVNADVARAERAFNEFKDLASKR